MAIDCLWTKRAAAHLKAELDYYGQINPDLAKQLAQTIVISVEKLMHMPTIGRVGKNIGVREFVLQHFPYVLAYRVRNDVLEIIGLTHQKRKNIQAFY